MYKLKTLAEYLGNSNDPLLQTIRPGFLLSFFLPHMGYSVKSTTLDVYISSNVTRNENIAQQYAHAAKSNQLNVESNLLDHPNFATSKFFFQKNTATAVFAHNTPIKYGHFNIKHSREIINFLTCMAESNELRLVSKGKTHWMATPLKVQVPSFLDFLKIDEVGDTTFQTFISLYEQTICEFMVSYNMTRIEAVRVISANLQAQIYSSQDKPVWAYTSLDDLNPNLSVLSRKTYLFDANNPIYSNMFTKLTGLDGL